MFQNIIQGEATINSEEQAAGNNWGTDQHYLGKQKRHAANPSALVSKKYYLKVLQIASGPSKVYIILVSKTTYANSTLII